MPLAPFSELAAQPSPRLDLLALALAAEFHEVDAQAAVERLDDLAANVVELLDDLGEDRSPEAEVAACAEVLGGDAGFRGDEEDYDHPRNSMLDVVLERRRGLPILLSVIYVEVARRAEVPLAGVGLPGHFVCGRFAPGADPLLIDPFRGGVPVGYTGPRDHVRPWVPREIAVRMLNNLEAAYVRRAEETLALRAADLREPLE